MSTKEKTNTAPSPSPTLPPPPSASPGPTDTNKSDAATITAVASASAVDDEACDVIQGFAELMEDDLVPEKDVTTIETLTSIALESSKYADVISDLVITRLKSVPFLFYFSLFTYFHFFLDASRPTDSGVLPD